MIYKIDIKLNIILYLLIKLIKLNIFNYLKSIFITQVFFLKLATLHLAFLNVYN